MTCHTLIPIADSSSIGEARRATIGLAAAVKLTDTDAGRASLVATEIATNLVRHANPTDARMLIGSSVIDGVGSIEIISIDIGPGMLDVARCFTDGYSTAGTPGNGLGAVRRLSDTCDLFSSSTGTVISCTIVSAQSPPRSQFPHRISALSVPAPYETACGDAWRAFRSDRDFVSLMIADGLGHGPLAAEASAAACKVFDENPAAAPAVLLDKMHAAISGTRGAAIAIARIDIAAEKLTYVGVGNIAGTLLAADGSSRGLFSHNGTVGHTVRKIQTFEYPWSPASLLVLHSDGLQTRWDLGKYPGLSRRHPAVIAGVLLRDFRRDRDDSTVLVVGPAQNDAA